MSQETTSQQPAKPQKKGNWWWLWLLLVIAIIVAGYYAFKLHHKSYIQTQTKHLQLAQQNQQRINQLLQRQQQLQIQLQQLQLTSKQQGNATEASALANSVRILERANLELKLDPNLQLTINLLQLAARDLERYNSITLNKIAKAVSKDIQRLQKVKNLNLDKLSDNFADLNQQVQSISFDLSQQVVSKPIKITQTGWRAWWQHLKAALGNVVVVEKVDNKYQPMVSRNNIVGLKIYCQTLIQQAYWAAVNQDQEIYQQRLQQLNVALATSLPASNQVLQQLQSEIAALEKINVQPPLPKSLNSLSIAYKAQQALDKATKGAE